MSKGKHHKEPFQPAVWHIVSAVAAVSLLTVAGLSGAITLITSPGPMPDGRAAYQPVRDSASAEVYDEQMDEEEAAIAEQDRLWIERIRELSQKQRQEMAARQAILEEEARQASLTAAAAPPTVSPAAGGLLLGDQSAALAIDIYLTGLDSPMAGYGRAFVSAGKTFGVDPFLVVSIAGKESSWGKHCFLPYNAWGWGEIAFTDWENAIFNYTRYLDEEYIEKGRISAAAIAPIYCPPNYAEWTGDVTSFYAELSAMQSGITR
jgi:hypothetical protein